LWASLASSLPSVTWLRWAFDCVVQVLPLGGITPDQA
jgi:hypothetical protein